MSTDNQKYSIDNQRAFIHAYAIAHGMKVATSYVDSGKSGLTLRRRAGLTQLLAEVISGVAPFKAILVYDVSRWGRFQDADESAHYEFLCRRAGIGIIYCAEQFAVDTTPLGSVLKSLKRAMAGEFSRELSVKVAAGKTRIGKMGFRVGGIAGFGLRRQLVVDGTTPGMVLRDRQWKSIQTDRVTLVPGPTAEVSLVRAMYYRYVYLRESERDIAAVLTREGYTFFGKPWTRNLVRNILTNEKYIGTNVVGRYRGRLYTRQVALPKDEWTRCENAFPAIVSRHLFEAAELVRRFNEKVFVSRDEIVKGLRAVLRREGLLNARLINGAPELPSSQVVARRLGSLSSAYEAVGYVPSLQYQHYMAHKHLMTRCASLQEELVNLLEDRGIRAWVARPPVLVFGESMKVEVMIRRVQGKVEGRCWRIKFKYNEGTDLVLAARLEEDGISIKDFLLVPRPDVDRLPVYLKKAHHRILAPYIYPSMQAVANRLAHSLSRQTTSKNLDRKRVRDRRTAAARSCKENA